ncbi:DUF805 domain-containing protein [Akkermansia sp.]|uniref:DUF805 domain-containing protein n=1 Tax=Akkermansia sp. TaxID=1872421 RepID=UPI0025D87269|nr:DUF805 domain-containing protein [Akkermansia sp.]MEE0764309.1 DUF805 domain-containing protein [Akkermansia sp.]
MPDVSISTPTPASLPAQASASPLEYWKKGFLHYAEFRGCASRPEFWWFMALPLLALVPALAGYIITDWLHIPNRRVSVYGDALTILLWVALVLPCVAVTFRRLHDTGRSGFWALVLLLPLGFGRLLFFYLTLSESKTENNKYCGNASVRASAAPAAAEQGPAQEQAAQPLTPFYLYWLISLRKLTTAAGRASRAEFWSFFLLSLFLFLPLGYNMVDYDSTVLHPYFSPSREILLYIAQPQDALILLAHACVNPTFYFFYQSGDLSTLSLELLIGVAGFNIMFNAAAAMRRLHDGNLSGKFILIPVCIFIISVLLIILLRVIPGDITPYLPYLTLCSNLMDQLSILFLAMMLIKGTTGPNKYGTLPQKITVS